MTWPNRPEDAFDHGFNGAQLAEQLGKVVPMDTLYWKSSDLTPFECDGLSSYRQKPLLVALPESTEQVQAIASFCHQHRVPLITRGAGTGLSGGALPHAQGILLSLTRFNNILHLDPNNRTAQVQSGVRNLAISEAAAEHGLYYAPDPSSQIACSIGGNVAENSGGVHCLKYGLTVHNILAIKLVTIEGELETIGSQGLDASGYDLLALMTGSEGMLGIIVEVTVKLLPKPQTAQVLMASFDDVGQAGQAVADIISAGIIPGGLEMMDNPAIRAVEDFVQVGYPVDAAAILLCELDGSPAAVDEDRERCKALLTSCGATSIRVSQNEAEREALWKGRKSAFPAVGRITPDYYCMDGTIPRRHLTRVLEAIQTFSEKYKLVVANVFHAGDGNLHPLIMFDANISEQLHAAEALGGDILKLCVEVGGSITGEHGVGMEKINQMCAQFNDLENTQFHAIKSAFDEKGLLNPGKAVPTLARCAEFGAMHVHHGELSHPELERF